MEELQLLSRARQSDAHGDYAEVLAMVVEHERRYPAGRLSEEREVLRVKALVGLGRSSEARHAATKFSRLFPRSVLLPKIEDMLASLK
jgi:outer membrane protein assembly factor BamD (BamD/ComL family)